jgi:hypothetical protein
VQPCAIRWCGSWVVRATNDKVDGNLSPHFIPRPTEVWGTDDIVGIVDNDQTRVVSPGICDALGLTGC